MKKIYINKTVFYRIITFLLLIAWMAVIFRFSAQTSEDSAETSSGFISGVFSVFYPGFSKLSAERQNEIISGFSFIFRKLAHFSLYFILGGFSFLAMIDYKKIKYLIRSLIAWGICIVYAVSDEIHQIFINGRSCELRDMLIDSLGALLSIVLLTVAVRCIKKLYIKVKG